MNSFTVEVTTWGTAHDVQAVLAKLRNDPRVASVTRLDVDEEGD